MEDNKKATFRPLYRQDGTSEFEEFYEQLPDKDRQKLLLIIANTEEKGMQIAMRQSWVKKLDTNLYELRSKVGTNIQRALYFQKVGSEYLITHGFTKRTQKTPKKEIEHAKNLREKYLKGELL
ncbi:type II toxin-antitoxin system RelE/ParE family toxin [Lactococcus lactis]|jgi:phage-related protein|uniref:type II toxin-antitoxin system RelE/ParE family toxin n=1 Tax=Lactococcus lactis TaxID=1358 RepID=UPI00223B5990|nr:type II toxin-antitoxin system RelE/ParE family toxin [Lactococcus lactis]MCT0449989.1 type II toxin-antitoxin system RelE/ParE family toxin [Lactococcus lactis subsp. lactis]MDR0289089.1 type II toxin-antitoxin system RelE/ParE family toxin [Rickettsiales bacterium]